MKNRSKIDWSNKTPTIAMKHPKQKRQIISRFGIIGGNFNEPEATEEDNSLESFDKDSKQKREEPDVVKEDESKPNEVLIKIQQKEHEKRKQKIKGNIKYVKFLKLKCVRNTVSPRCDLDYTKKCDTEYYSKNYGMIREYYISRLLKTKFDFVEVLEIKDPLFCPRCYNRLFNNKQTSLDSLPNYERMYLMGLKSSETPYHQNFRRKLKFSNIQEAKSFENDAMFEDTKNADYEDNSY